MPEERPPEGPEVRGEDWVAEVVVHHFEHETVVQLCGEIDLAVSEELSRAAQEAAGSARPARLDVREVTFIDSTGIGYIARLASAEQAQGRRLRVTGASRRIEDTLVLSGLGELLEWEPS